MKCMKLLSCMICLLVSINVLAQEQELQKFELQELYFSSDLKNLYIQEQRSPLMERLIAEGYLERTKFTEAVSTGNTAVVKSMLLSGYDVESASARLGLVVASQAGYIDIVRSMLLAGVDQSFSFDEFTVPPFLQINSFGSPFVGGARIWIALREAAYSGHAQVVNLLLVDIFNREQESDLFIRSVSSIITIARDNGYDSIANILTRLMSMY